MAGTIILGFQNNTSRNIKIFHVTVHGPNLHYFVSANSSYHAFVRRENIVKFKAKDVKTGNRMLLNGYRELKVSDIAQDFKKIYGINLRQERIIISVPVLTLKSRCIEVIKSSMHSRQDVLKLPIPEKMQDKFFGK